VLKLTIGSSYIILVDEPTANLDIHLWLEGDQFRSMVDMALDPVCDRSVDRKRAPAQATHQGCVFCFRAHGCQDEFLKDPEQLV
jgi:YHS domain-containing protein